MSDKELEQKVESVPPSNEKKESVVSTPTQVQPVEKKVETPVNVQPQPEVKKVETPVSPQPQPAVKKEEAPAQPKQPEIKIQIGGGGKKLNNEFAHNTPQDVNANVGSFGNIKDPSKEEAKSADELIVSDKSKQFENIKGKDVEIDFAKFEKQKTGKKRKQREYKPGKTQFAVTLDTWLHNRSTCIKVWMVALAIMIVCLAVGLGLAIPSVINLKKSNNNWWSWYHAQAIAGTVFGFIASLIFFIPLIYLLITQLVGIKGVATSRVFHYFLWTCLIIAVVSLILCCGLIGPVMANANAFTAPK